MTKAENILKKLVAQDPTWAEVQSYTVICTLCDATGPDSPIKHKKSCAWQQAVKYLKSK
jgi:hypothetical protein